MKLAIGRLLALLALLVFPVLASCPYQEPCPRDGEPGENTYNCKGQGDTHACQYLHSFYNRDENRQVHHYYWVACPD